MCASPAAVRPTHTLTTHPPVLLVPEGGSSSPLSARTATSKRVAPRALTCLRVRVSTSSPSSVMHISWGRCTSLLPADVGEARMSPPPASPPAAVARTPTPAAAAPLPCCCWCRACREAAAAARGQRRREVASIAAFTQARATGGSWMGLHTGPVWRASSGSTAGVVKVGGWRGGAAARTSPPPTRMTRRLTRAACMSPPALFSHKRGVIQHPRYNTSATQQQPGAAAAGQPHHPHARARDGARVGQVGAGDGHGDLELPLLQPAAAAALQRAGGTGALVRCTPPRADASGRCIRAAAAAAAAVGARCLKIMVRFFSPSRPPLWAIQAQTLGPAPADVRVLGWVVTPRRHGPPGKQQQDQAGAAGRLDTPAHAQKHLAALTGALALLPTRWPRSRRGSGSIPPWLALTRGATGAQAGALIVDW